MNAQEMQGRSHEPQDRPVGEILRQARLYHKLSLSDVERSLNIRAQQIEAIETNHAEYLPARVYAIGFVRSYASYLGLDPEKIVELFRLQSVSAAPQPDLHFPVMAKQSKVPNIWIILGCVLGVFIVLSVWWSLPQNQSQPQEIPALPQDEETDLSIALGGSALEQSENEVPLVPAEEQGIVLTILESSWVQIKDQEGNNIVSRVLNAGDQYFVPNRPDLTMALGNAGGVSLRVDGVDLAPLGGVGDVRRDIVLDVEQLKTLEKAPESTP